MSDSKMGALPKCKSATVTLELKYEGMEDQTITWEMDSTMLHWSEHRSIVPVYDATLPDRPSALLPAPEVYVVIHGVTTREMP